jgi:UDP-glucose 4-epimerase
VKAFVTGCAGFIGSTLSERLLADGADVVGVDCFTDYYPRPVKERNLSGALAHPRFRFLESPIQDLDLTAELIDRTHIFHLAAQAGVRKSWGRDFAIYSVNNIEATQLLLEAATSMPSLERLVYSSSSSVYGDRVAMPMREDALPEPVSPYGVSKLAAEQLCYLYFANFRVPTVSLRYFTVYGPRQRPDMAFTRIAMCLAEGRPFDLFGDGLQSRSFTYVADVVRGTILAMQVGSGTYNVGGGEEATMRDTIAIFEELAGRPLEIRDHPAVPGDQRRTKADTTLIRSELGWEPTTSLRDGLAAQWEWAAARVATR